MIKWMLFIPATALICILFFYYFDLIFGGKKKALRIDVSKEIKPSRREYRNTFSNLLVFGLTGLFLGYAVNAGWTRVYSGWPASGWEIVYLVASFFLALAAHDIYFYVTHRILHIKYIFRHVHSLHHHSHNSNAWSAFSFHFLEGVVQIGIVLLLAFFMPVHEYVLMLFVFFMLFISVYGHSGYELRANKWKGFNLFNTSLHHFQHHQYVRYNFGIYLNIWDRLFASNYPGYDASVTQLSAQIKSRKAEAKHPSHVK